MITAVGDLGGELGSLEGDVATAGHNEVGTGGNRVRGLEELNAFDRIIGQHNRAAKAAPTRSDGEIRIGNIEEYSRRAPDH